MSFDNFVARWRQMEEQNDIAPPSPYASKWTQLPKGNFPFLQPDELQFLREVGFPDKAPYFRFEELGERMPQVDEVYCPDDEELWAKIGREKVDSFRMLGSDGSGNPLVLDIHSREIWLLDHEGSFAPLDLVNTSLASFVETLLLFKHAESQIEIQGCEVDVEELLQQLRSVDSRAAEQGAFWHEYAQDLNDLI